MTCSYGGDPRPDLVPADPILLSDSRSSSNHGSRRSHDDCNSLIELDTVASNAASEGFEYVKCLSCSCWSRRRSRQSVKCMMSRDAHPNPLTYLIFNFFISGLPRSPLILFFAPATAIIETCSCCEAVRHVFHRHHRQHCCHRKSRQGSNPPGETPIDFSGIQEPNWLLYPRC